MIERPIQWHDIIRGDASLPPLLMLHGFMGAGADWMDVADDLSKHHRCICPDLPGHGSTRGVPKDMRACADALLLRLDQLDVAQCALLGYSMGGRLALYLAAHHPDRFTRVVIESASPGLKSEDARAQRLERDKALAEELEELDGAPQRFTEFLVRWYEQPMFASMARHEGRLKQFLDRRLRNNPGALADVLRTLGPGAQPSVWEALEDYATPTLVLAGGLDRKFCFIAEAMSDACPKIAMREIEDCGHNIHFENTKAFVTTVTAFFCAGSQDGVRS